MNRISLVRLKLALQYRLAIAASPGGGWLFSQGWAMDRKNRPCGRVLLERP
jgi:hypothetical protein